MNGVLALMKELSSADVIQRGRASVAGRIVPLCEWHGVGGIFATTAANPVFLPRFHRATSLALRQAGL